LRGWKFIAGGVWAVAGGVVSGVVGGFVSGGEIRMLIRSGQRGERGKDKEKVGHGRTRMHMLG
jgi:hypothetical protein